MANPERTVNIPAEDRTLHLNGYADWTILIPQENRTIYLPVDSTAASRTIYVTEKF